MPGNPIGDGVDQAKHRGDGNGRGLAGTLSGMTSVMRLPAPGLLGSLPGLNVTASGSAFLGQGGLAQG